MDVVRGIAVIAALLALTASAHADPWQTNGTLYGHLAGMDGHTVVHGNRSDIDVSSGDLLDHPDAAVTMALRSEKERFALGIDVVFIGLSAEATHASGMFHDVEITQDMVELTWSRRLDERYELFAGGRYQSFAAEISRTTVAGTYEQAYEVESLFDPIAGARASWSVAPAWKVIARAHLGGIGIGSDFTWSALAAVDWSFSSNFGVVLGYRVLETDYSRGSGGDRFDFEVLISGPILGIRYDFQQ